ncbi:MAG TPA: group II intron reverse transcriptase/maturase, partial [Gemmatimonadaceae bacterium]|nr:group II intron reverse transcriptase/maturase [Gemmatimonadaceae bacterium]
SGVSSPPADGQALAKRKYGRDLERNLQDLHARLVSKRYRHQPIRRVHIPKEKGKTRPIGISAFEDKLVQDAVREVLEAVYEQDFLPCSHGFRPQRSAHDAIRALDRIAHRGKVSWILEADIVSFFDSLDRPKLAEMLQTRVADGSLLRLVGKCLHVGVLDGATYAEPDTGTAQGSVLSPLLGNVYLHYVLDLWFEREVKPRLRGEAHLVRYADDFVMTFETKDDAERVMEVLGKRMGRFGLTLHPTKTRLLPFRRPSAGQLGGKGPATFDFLGFTLYWRRSRSGRWGMTCKTRTVRLRRSVMAIAAWCRRHRHLPVRTQHAALTRRIQGHVNYFGVSGNFRSLLLFVYEVERAWYKWLRRRSQQAHLDWEGFRQLLERMPLPRPSIKVRIWGT